MNRYENCERILRLKDVIHKTGLSRSTIYAWIAEGNFPKPYKISERSVRWREGEIDAWIASKCGIDLGMTLSS